MVESAFKFSIDLLREYSRAALRNAGELLQEATLLYENRHIARAYFLAVASIEETGKALLAFIGQGRNLKDPAVATKQRQVMENHSQKISAAFIPTMRPEDPDEIMACVNLTIPLTQGREPSMYTDIDYATSKIQAPKAMVRDVAARDCVHLAGVCLANANKYIANEKPTARSKDEDRLFTMKLDHLKEIGNTADFWFYYINEVRSGRADWAAAVVNYRHNFILKGKTFNSSDGQRDSEGQRHG